MTLTVDKAIIREEFEMVEEQLQDGDTSLAAMYAKRNCKQCIGKGYQRRSWVLNGQKFQQTSVCHCVKSGIEKAMI